MDRIDEGLLRSLTQMLVHRGPDSSGIYLHEDVALGVRRLSIIDVEGGTQPIVSEDGRYVIVLNGEIYNHAELRRDLVARGHRLRTRSDTETLLHAYMDAGPKCLASLNGMFAFAIWDGVDRELFLARDRLGIKPLYYARDARRLMFCSELTPIRRAGLFPLHLDFRAIADYLAYWYVCEPSTIFDGMRQLPPGTYAVVRDGRVEETRYWEIPAGPEEPIAFDEAATRLGALVEDAVRLRMGVDVPVGTFLSGGVDSGLVTALAARHARQPLRSFAIGFRDPSYSEIDDARRTAARLGVDLFTVSCDPITPDMVDEVFEAFDEPLGNASAIPTYFLAKATRAHVKVVLTGDGGDELFGGYPTYQAPYYQRLYRFLPGALATLAARVVQVLPVSHRRISLDYRLKQLAKGIALPYERAHVTWREVADRAVQASLFRDDVWAVIAGYDPFSVAESYFRRAAALGVKNRLMFVDLHTYLLGDHLRKVDRMTMAHSVEAGVPFLDHRVVEFAMRLPGEHKVTFRQTKRILKRVAEAHLPAGVVHGKKRGLTSPIAGWLAVELRDYARDRLRGEIVGELFRPAAVERLLDDHERRRRDNSRVLWALLALQAWGRRLRGA